MSRADESFPRTADLTRRYAAKGIKREWKWLNKQILEESAKALNVSPSKIKYIFQSQRKTMLDEIVGALSTRYYKSDKKMRNTIIEVIRSIAKKGDVIIVGRGGVAFSDDNPDSLASHHGVFEKPEHQCGN